MVPAIRAQYDDFQAGRIPGLHALAKDVWAVGLPLFLEGGGLISYTLCYVLRDSAGTAHIIDPGDGREESMTRLEHALTDLGISRVGSIFLTHRHPDHAGAATVLGDRFAATVMLGAADHLERGAETDRAAVMGAMHRWGVPSRDRDELAAFGPESWEVEIRPSRLLEDGDMLEVPGRELRVLATAGHTAGHVCLLDESNTILFSGDHVLPAVQPGVGFGGFDGVNPLQAYLDSLERIRALEHCLVAPGHGYVFRGLDERARSIQAHHMKRNREVEAALEDAPDESIWIIATGLRWRSGGWDDLPITLRFAALHQTENHVRLVRDVSARREESRDRGSREEPDRPTG